MSPLGPIRKQGQEASDFVGRERHCVGVQVVQDPKSDTLGGRRGYVTGGGGQPEIKIFRQLKKTVELMLSEMFGPEADIIIDITLSLQIPA